MGLASTIKAAVAQAKVAVADVLVSVQHRVASAPNVDAEYTLADAVAVDAVVEYKTRTLTQGDRTIVSSARITFIEPRAVGMHDEFTLPDGKTAPVVSVNGVASSVGAGLMYATFVDLGVLR